MHMNYPRPLSVLLKGCISLLFVPKDHPLQSFELSQHLLYALHFCPSEIYYNNIYSTTFLLVGIQEEYTLQMKKSKLVILDLDEIKYKHMLFANIMMNDAIETLSCTTAKI
jgi:hypothetical protein